MKPIRQKTLFPICCIFLLLLMLSIEVSPLNASSPLNAGSNIHIINKTVFIPVRFLLEKGVIAELVWSQAENRIHFTAKGTRFTGDLRSGALYSGGKRVGNITVHHGRSHLSREFIEQHLGVPIQFSTAVSSLPGRVPMLMYHELGELIHPTFAGSYAHPEVFIQTLEALQKNGYNTVTMQQVYDHWVNGHQLPAKPIVITFDDGYTSHYEIATLELAERNMVGTFYIYTDKIGGRNGLTEEQISLMHKAGMEIASHSASHPRLDTLSEAELEKEVRQSKEILERIIKAEVRHFCYPFGGHNQTTQSVLKKHGFLSATTTREGVAEKSQGLLTLSRLKVSYHDSAEDLLAKLR